jgi:hypothetical protein
VATYICHGKGDRCCAPGCHATASGIQVEWILTADGAGDEVHHGPLCDVHRRATFGIYDPAVGRPGGMLFMPFSGEGPPPRLA